MNASWMAPGDSAGSGAPVDRVHRQEDDVAGRLELRRVSLSGRPSM